MFKVQANTIDLGSQCWNYKFAFPHGKMFRFCLTNVQKILRNREHRCSHQGQLQRVQQTYGKL